MTAEIISVGTELLLGKENSTCSGRRTCSSWDWAA